jgi:hypothetical protein
MRITIAATVSEIVAVSESQGTSTLTSATDATSSTG